MRSDKFSNVIYEEKDIIDLLYRNQLEFLPQIYCDKSQDIKKLSEISDIGLRHIDDEIYSISIEDFDDICKKNWFIPEDYKKLDIAKWIIDQCQNDEEISRAGEELAEFQERNMIPLLQWLKYLVDTCRANNIVWGVGRGSSVSSFVLFLIGVHKIDPIKYNLDWQDFLR
jgi:DNA polymerase III alpha subunit